MAGKQWQTVIPKFVLYLCAEKARPKILRFLGNFKGVLQLLLQQFRCKRQFVFLSLLQQFRRCGRVVSLGLQAIRGRILERITNVPNLTTNRACKFLLNRFLGRLIRVVIDLDRLEIQLGVRTIQLNCVALNTDFLNRHLSVTPVNVKEGFIDSISIKIPWKLFVADSGKFEINVEELVLVLVSRTDQVEASSNSAEECFASELCSEQLVGATDACSVQDWVRKMVAHIKEKLLLGLHVKIKNLIIAFEQRPDTSSTNLGVESSCQYQSILGLRVLQTQYGTHAFGPYPDDVVLISLIDFRDVTAYLFDIIDKDVQPGRLRSLDILRGVQPGKSPVPVPLIHGNEGGFSGSVQLTIPWKNISLDFPKVDVQIDLDPVKLQLRPSTMQKLISLLHSIVECGEEDMTEYGEEGIIECGEKNGGPEPRLCSSDRQSFSDLLSAAQPSGQQRLDCNLNARLDGVSVILAFEDHGHANIVSPLNRPRFECLQQNTDDLDTESNYLEVNIEDWSFSAQVSAQEMRIKTMVKHIEIFEHIHDDSGNATKRCLSKCKEYSEGNMFSTAQLQKQVEEALPPFPVSLYIAEPVVNINNEVLPHDSVISMASQTREKNQISTGSTFKKFVKIKLLAFQPDCTHNLSMDFHFRNTKHGDYLISCTEFEVQLETFVLWVDFCAANKLCQLIEGIGYHSKFSDKAKHGGSFIGRTDIPQRSIQINVSTSLARIILSFPMENINQYTNPYLLRDNFICIELSEPVSVSECEQEELLKESEISLNGIHFPSSNFVGLKMGESILFLIHPSEENKAKLISGDLDEMQFSAWKVLILLNGKERDFSFISFRWQEIPGTGLRNEEKEWEEGNEQCTRGGRGSRGVSGNNSEFHGASTAGALEVKDSDIQEKIIRNSSVFIQFCSPHAQLDLYGSEHILIANLLSLLTNCICFEGNKETCLNLAGKPVKRGFHSEVAQSSILIECNVVDIAIDLAESTNIRVFRDVALERELTGFWSSFRLTVRNVDVLYVSNRGGVSGASYFSLNHEEALLYGSLIDKLENSQSVVAARELCLLCCEKNVFGRCNGEGNSELANGNSDFSFEKKNSELANGNAGTTITHLYNRRDLQSLTAVSVRGCTLIAPGGRLDYLASIISFFNQSSQVENQIIHTDPQERQGKTYFTSISLELLDIAVSYEPFLKGSRISSAANNVEEACAPVACILAAAAVRVLSKTNPSTENTKYTISLEDVGLLVLDLSKGSNNELAYDVESLQSAGYIKVTGTPVMDLEVEMNGQNNLLWEVTCTKTHIWLATCHDTTAALTILIQQLQHLFEPDYEDYVVHLQTRRDIWKDVISLINEKRSLQNLENQRSPIRILPWYDKNILPTGQISLANCKVTWKICAGSDWPAWKIHNSIRKERKQGRNGSSEFEAEFQGVNAQYDIFPECGGLYASKLSLSVQDLTMIDCTGRRPWKTILCNKQPRDSFAKALTLDLEAVTPDRLTPLKDQGLHLKLLPLQLNLDHRQVEFLVAFFSEKAYTSEMSAEEELHRSFIRKCEVCPLSIQLDYVPRVDLNVLLQGNFSQFAKSLLPYKALDLHLKEIKTNAIFGWSNVAKVVLGKWGDEIPNLIREGLVHKLFKCLIENSY